MSIPVEVLTAEVLGLPAEERSQLLDRLIESLDPTPIDDDWARAWSDEADRRESDIEAGRAQWVPGEEALGRLRARLK